VASCVTALNGKSTVPLTRGDNLGRMKRQRLEWMKEDSANRHREVDRLFEDAETMLEMLEAL